MRILVLLSCALISAFGFGDLRRSAGVNAWSLELARAAASDAPVSPEALDGLFRGLPQDHWVGGVVLARAAVAAGEPELALAWLEPLADSRERWVLKARGEAFAALGRVEDAAAAWEAAADWRAAAAAAEAARREGRDEDELAFRKAVYRISPDFGALPLANAIQRLRRDSASAAAVLAEAIEKNPDVPQWRRLSWLYAMGNLLRTEEDWGGAEAAYREMARLAPGDFRSHIGLGWVFYGRDADFDGALSEFLKAAELAPENGVPRMQIATLYVREGRREEADRWYAEALELNPGARTWYLSRASTARGARDYGHAAAVYREAIRRFPDDAAVWYELAWTLSLAGEHEEAIDSIEEAIRLDGGGTAAYWTRAGLIHERAGQPEKAANHFRRALKRDPDTAAARRALERVVGETSEN
jgi:tetratricopeptide (TPR) repeat protein